MRVVLLGTSSQLSQAIRATQPADCSVVFCGFAELTKLNEQQLLGKFKSFAPDWLINCCAFNAVDIAELQPELALNGNFVLVTRFQRLAEQLRARLLHFSSDFVFDGQAGRPYIESDMTLPLNHYGKTKLMAELWLQRQYSEKSLIFRTSSLYSAHGRNFVSAVYRQLCSGKRPVVVRDQTSSPTSCNELAKLVWLVICKPEPLNGLYHAAGNKSISKADFADEILYWFNRRHQGQNIKSVERISTSDLKGGAPRPLNSSLCSAQLHSLVSFTAIDWREQLWAELENLENQSPSK